MNARLLAGAAALVLLLMLTVPALSPVVSTQPADPCGPNPSPPNAADPSVRVTEPTAGARVSSPLRISGRARVFEATVSLALIDAGSTLVARGFATAAEAAPALAPFTTELRFTAVRETPACLWGFEQSAADGSLRNAVQVPLTLLPLPAIYSEAALDLGDVRPCIPAPEQQACDATRTALWNGEAAAWRARGVTDPDARFNETVVFRVQAGDPVAISNIAKLLGWPYVKITRLRFIGTPPDQADEFVEITNLGGGAQDMSTWVIEAPPLFVPVVPITPRFTPVIRFIEFAPGFVLAPGRSCRFYTGVRQPDPCPEALGMFRSKDYWPDVGGAVTLRFRGLNLLGDFTRYSADPASQPPPPNLQGVEPPMTTAPAAIQFTLSTSKEVYAPGEPVEFRMVLRNAGGAPLELTFTSGQHFDVTVSTEAGEKVWQWALGRFFTQIVSTITLAPGEATTFTATWDQQPNGPPPSRSRPGTYHAQAVLTAGERPVSNTVTFRIGSP